MGKTYNGVKEMMDDLNKNLRKCKKCGYKWYTRLVKTEPKLCPNCKCRSWKTWKVKK